MGAHQQKLTLFEAGFLRDSLKKRAHSLVWNETKTKKETLKELEKEFGMTQQFIEKILESE